MDTCLKATWEKMDSEFSVLELVYQVYQISLNNYALKENIERIKTWIGTIWSFKEGLQGFLSLSYKLFKNAHFGLLKGRENAKNKNNSSQVKKMFVHEIYFYKNNRNGMVIHNKHTSSCFTDWYIYSSSSREHSQEDLTSYGGHHRAHCSTVMWERATLQVFPALTQTNIQAQLRTKYIFNYFCPWHLVRWHFLPFIFFFNLIIAHLFKHTSMILLIARYSSIIDILNTVNFTKKYFTLKMRVS